MVVDGDDAIGRRSSTGYTSCRDDDSLQKAPAEILRERRGTLLGPLHCKPVKAFLLVWTRDTRKGQCGMQD
jgi:hypothetical protein